MKTVWGFSFSSAKWSKLKLSGNLPHARSGHCSFHSNHHLFLIGGKSSNNDSHFNNLVEIDLGIKNIFSSPPKNNLFYHFFYFLKTNFYFFLLISPFHHFFFFEYFTFFFLFFFSFFFKLFLHFFFSKRKIELFCHFRRKFS